MIYIDNIKDLEVFKERPHILPEEKPIMGKISKEGSVKKIKNHKTPGPGLKPGTDDKMIEKRKLLNQSEVESMKKGTNDICECGHEKSVHLHKRIVGECLIPKCPCKKFKPRKR